MSSTSVPWVWGVGKLPARQRLTILSHQTALTDLPAFDVRPLVAFDIQRDSSKSREQDDGLDTSLLALVVFGLSRPVKESDNILGHLGCCSGSAVWVLDELVEEHTSHGDGVTREVSIVVHAVTDLEARRGVGVAGKEREDVILYQSSIKRVIKEAMQRFYARDHHDEP